MGGKFSLLIIVVGSFLVFHPLTIEATLTFKGITYGCWSKDEYLGINSDASLDNLKNTGANYVALLVTQYMDTGSSTTIYRDGTKTPTDAAIIEAIADIHNRDMKVILDPYFDCKDGTWRGAINPSDTDAWFNSYNTFITHYAQIAEDNNVELLCIGKELTSMSGTYTSKWNWIIDNVKSIYNGSLTFCANFYIEYEKLSFWNRIDIAGISVYCDLVDESNPDPSLSEIIDSWSDSWNGHNWIQEFENWQSLVKKPVIFTEVGYCSVDKAAYKPWDGPRDYPYNGNLQARCYEAVFRVFKNRNWFQGMFWWGWMTDPNAGIVGNPYYRDYTPQNKPAENVLKT